MMTPRRAVVFPLGDGVLAINALAVDTFLVPTDEGIARVEMSQGQTVLTRTFPDTEPFVDAASRLLAACSGIS